MSSALLAHSYTTLVLKNCGQAAIRSAVTVDEHHRLSTASNGALAAQWKHTSLFPITLHKFCMQFYPAKIGPITDSKSDFSPLSTPLIIRAIQVIKENLLIGMEDKWI